MGGDEHLIPGVGPGTRDYGHASNGGALATRNTSDFEGCGVKLINPYE